MEALRQPIKTRARLCSCLFMAAAAMAITLTNSSSAWAQAVCNPACAPGQVCVQGTCMIPAPAPPASSYPPAPPPYQQTAPATGAQPYGAPPAGTYAPPPASTYYPPQQPGSPYSPPVASPYPPTYGGGGYAPPPPPAGIPRRRGFLALPFLGIHSFQGETGNNLGAGFRLGALLGGRISPSLSLNGELTIDALNIENQGPGEQVSAADAVLAFSPLFHFPAGPNAELVVGPKLGLRAAATSAALPGEAATTSKTSGYVFGLNAGVFAAINDNVSLGGLLQAEIRSVHRFCSTAPGELEQCFTDDFNTGPSDKVIGLVGAALF